RRLNEHLATFRIDEAAIDIDEDCKRVLRKNDIEDASDLNGHVMASLGGIGRKSVETLTQWRRSLEGSFAIDPVNDISQSEIELIDNEIISISAKLQSDIENGRLALRRISEQAKVAP